MHLLFLPLNLGLVSCELSFSGQVTVSHKCPDKEPVRALFVVGMIEKDGEFCLSTAPERFVESIGNVFDRGVNGLQEIPQLEPFVMDKFFWSGVPPLRAPYPKEQRIVELRVRAIKAMESSLAPLRAFLNYFQKFSTLAKQQPEQYVKAYAQNPHTVEEMRQEVEGFRKKKDEIMGVYAALPRFLMSIVLAMVSWIDAQ